MNLTKSKKEVKMISELKQWFGWDDFMLEWVLEEEERLHLAYEIMIRERNEKK